MIRVTKNRTRSKPGDAQHRRCLMCGAPFSSEGSHNRICKKCKGSQAWRDGQQARVMET